MNLTRQTKRRLVYAAAALLSALAFTPLVSPVGVAEPFVLGMPRTLWAGILITVGLVYLTYLAARYSPSDEARPDSPSAPDVQSSGAS